MYYIEGVILWKGMSKARQTVKDSLRRNKGILFGCLVLATITQVFSLFDPLLFQVLVDDYALQADTLPGDTFLLGTGLVTLGIVGVAFVSRLAKTFKDYYVSVISERVGTSLYASSIEHTLNVDYGVFQDKRSGETLQKIEKARNDVKDLIDAVVNNFFLPLIGVLFVIVYAFIVHPYVGAAFLVSTPIMTYAVYVLSKKIKEAQSRIVRKKSELSGSMTETLRNVELVKSLGLEAEEVDRLSDVNEEVLDLELDKVREVRKLSFLQGTAVNGARSAILFLMLYLINAGAVSLGQLMTLFFYSFLVFGPLQRIGEVASAVQAADASMELLDDIYTIPREETGERTHRIECIDTIRLEGVSYTYPETGEYAVDNASFTVRSGETTALVGPSGSGKSTTIKLLLGLYRPDTGTVCVNEEDLETVELASYRKRIGIVTQESQLFATSIRENLLFVAPNAEDERLLEVLEQAEVAHIVERSEDGLGAKIGEGGIKLSGGERQRLAIARALLRNPDVLLLDEATSSLDSVTERKITRTVQRIGEQNQGLAVVVIAHRLSTVIHADHIHVLKNGSVQETGTHEELLQVSELYKSLWNVQDNQTI